MNDYEIEIITRPRHVDISVIDYSEPRAPTLAEIESKYIANIVALFHNNHSRAAEALGITRKTLRDKCRKYGIPLPRSKA